MLNRSSPIPLYIQIEQGIQGLIVQGELGAGDKIPSEVVLAEHYHVSRMTARKAVDRLVSSGVLFRKQGMGTYVNSQRIHHGLSTKLSFSAAMDSLGLQHSTRVLIADLVQAPAHVLSALREMGSGQAIRIKRIRLVAGEPVALHETFVPSGYSMILEQDLTGSLTKAMTAVGAKVVTVRDTVSATLANEMHATLLNTEVGAALLEIHGLGYGDDGRPLRFTKAFYRGDRFTFELEAAPPSDMTFDIAVRQLSPA